MQILLFYQILNFIIPHNISDDNISSNLLDILYDPKALCSIYLNQI